MATLLDELRDAEKQMVETAGRGLGQMSAQDYAVLSGQRALLRQIIQRVEALEKQEAA